MQRAVRVFMGEGRFCPGFQLSDGVFHEPVLRLFKQALELKIPHNVFAAWMVSLLPPSASNRPVDMLDNMPLLQNTLTAFADQYGRSRSAADRFTDTAQLYLEQVPGAVVLDEVSP
jgi:hypothetical protein